MENLTTLERQIEKSRRAVADNPRDVDALMSYAQGCLRRDLRLEALQTFQKVLEITPDPLAFFSLARIFFLQMHYAEAYEELRKLFNVDPVNVSGHVLLHMLNECEEAPEDLRPRLAFVPSRDSLSHQYMLLENERDVLKREVLEYQSLVAGVSDPEPIMLYYVEEAKKRVSRVMSVISWCGKWDQLAVSVATGAQVAPVKGTKATPPSPKVVSPVAKTPEESPAQASQKTSGRSRVQGSGSAVDGKVEGKSVSSPVVAEASKEKSGEPTKSSSSLKADGASDNVAKVASAVGAESASKSVTSDKKKDASPDKVVKSASGEADGKGKAEVSEQPVETSKPEPVQTPVAPTPKVIKPLSSEIVQKVSAGLEKLTGTRGINRAMVVCVDSRLVAKEGEFENPMELIIGTVEGMHALVGYSNKLQFWALECKKGIVIVQQLSADYMLILDCAVGNVAALRHGAEKVRAELSELLQA